MSVTLSQNEISARAARFAGDWKDTEREEAEAQSFLIEFFHVLGVSRKRVAIFEHKVQCADGGSGYIDLFWKGHILIEMKSRGKDLGKAYEQAKRYADSLAHHEFPRAILVCDFENWHFYDLSNDGQLTTFTLSELPQYIHLFHFLAGYEQREYQEEDPVNVQAAELLGRLHDSLKAIGYIGHPLEVYLVRILFCLFADDTGIFRKDIFRSFIQDITSEDGNDLAARLAELFQVLNTPEKQRLCTRNNIMKEFPYVNGGLFAEFLPMPAFDSVMRRVLLDCCALDWSRISPAIFGSMFQSVMNAEERRALGAHYTSERNILKLINPLFMDALREEFEGLQHDKSNQKATKLAAFHKKLTTLTFLDPACGCGNFLVVAYRELRRLELAVIAEREKLELAVTGTKWMLSANDVCLVNVNQFYGIEIEEFPAQIAQVAMWLMDHQMNIEAGHYFGEAYARIPLTASATIVCGNALRIDWESVVPKEMLSYILGNPPFIGHQLRTAEQIDDMNLVFSGSKNYGKLDYVCCWFKKSMDFLKDCNIEAAFVATNSIVQGESVICMWKSFFEAGFHIKFAHQTFKWSNEGRGVAAVHCVIIGICNKETDRKLLYNSEGVAARTKFINGYLVDAPDIYIQNRSKSLNIGMPPIIKGSQPTDGGNLIMSDSEKISFLQDYPECQPFIRLCVGASEFLSGAKRWCFWFYRVSPSLYKNNPYIRERLEKIAAFRRKSPTASVQKDANSPYLFTQIRQPESDYIIIPRHSSEKRIYIPIGFVSSDVIATDAVYIIPNASFYLFGIITSQIHMAWMRVISGRLEMRYRYTPAIYNNFPWPEVSEAQKEKISELAQGVLDARALYPDSSLADLYDPLTMPPELVAAHRKLDAAVEKAYGRKFADDAERVAFLFEKYSELVNKESK